MTESESKKNSSGSIIILGVVIVLVVGVFVVGLNIDRDTFRDPSELVWNDQLEGAWVFMNQHEAEEILQFGGTQQYLLMLADPALAHLSREGRYTFVAVSEESATIELLPVTAQQESMILVLTKMDDGQMTGDFTTDDYETPYELIRRI